MLQQLLQRRLKPSTLKSGTLTGEDVFFFLLAARWLALIPPLVALIHRDYSPVSQNMLLLAIACNLLLSGLYPQVNRWLSRYPALLLIDMALMAFLLWGSGGTASAYYFFALSPLLAAAFFFQIRGGLIAAIIFTPLYILVTISAAQHNKAPFNVVAASVQIVAFFGTACLMGYPSVLLQRLRESNLELYRTQEELSREQTLAAMGRLVAHVSHEIRNPLTTIGGYAHHLVRKPDNPETVRNHAKIIAEEVRRLEELLNDMLGLARPQSTTRRPASLHEILDRACLLAGAPQAAKIVVRKEYDTTMPLLEVDASALLRAWLNTIRNAVQAMPDGGTLTIATKHDHQCARICISDTGCGIAPDILPTIWTPFVTHRESGTGLGLAVTQQIIHEHRGSIRVESEVGKGTAFHFALPIMQSTLKPATDGAPTDSQAR
jgi:signal transduction histidine kinase